MGPSAPTPSGALSAALTLLRVAGTTPLGTTRPTRQMRLSV